MAPAWLQNLQLAVIAVSSLIYCSCLMILFIGVYVYGSVCELISLATSTHAVPQLTIIMHSYMTVYHIRNKWYNSVLYMKVILNSWFPI